MFKTRILVIGATGTVGSALMVELAGQEHVRALVRDPEAAARLRELGTEVVLGSYTDDASLAAALDDVAVLFLLTPPGEQDMVRAQIRIVDHAVAAGVRHVVKLSSIGVEDPAAAGIVRAHREIERHIERSGVTWTHLRPHWFMDNELGQAEAIAEGAFTAPHVGTIAPIDARDIAAVAARVLTGTGHAGRAYVLTGPEALSYATLADRYTRLLGHTVRWREQSLDEARHAMVGAGLPAKLAHGFAEIMGGYRRGGTYARVSPAVTALLGRAPRTFDAFVADHLSHFRPAA